MARRMALTALVLLAACQREPDFDERYAQAEKAIASKAAALDRELEQREAEQGDKSLPPTAAATASPAPAP